MKESFQEGNIGVTYRVSNGTHANMVLGIDILETVIENYKRRSDGSIIYDDAGVPVPDPETPTVSGYSAKMVLKSNTIQPNQLGELERTNGEQEINGVQSTFYPLYEVMEQNPGAFGNNDGLMIFAPPAGNLDVAEITELSSFPYMLSVIQRDNDFDSGGLLPSKYSEAAVEFHMNPRAVSKYDDSPLDFKSILRDRWTNDKDPDLPLRYGPYVDYIHAYEDNIRDVLTMCYTKERDFIDAHPDLPSAQPLDVITDPLRDQYMYLFNLLGGKDTSGIPYYTFSFNVQGVSNGVILSNQTKLWAGNGEDNNMSVTDYEREVRKIIKMYGDCGNQVQDLATHPENWFYDTGFGFETKKAIKEFISQRPDTIIATGTGYDTLNIKGYIEPEQRPDPLPPDWVEPEISNLTTAEELQLGGIIESELRSKPESTYFGTPAMRAFIMANTAESTVPGWHRRVNYTHYLIPRCSRRFGQADGKWKRGANFSAAPGNVIRDLIDTSVRWIPYATELQYWKKNINFPYSFDYDRDFMPAVQSIYPLDSSTLNGLSNIQMISALWTIAYKAWRQFSGTDDKEPSDLAAAVTAFVIKELRGKFDDNYNIAVLVYFTEDDEKRGYSWTLKYMVEQGMMYTVESVIIETYRFNQIFGQDLIRA